MPTTPPCFSDTVRQAMAQTGLSAGELGIARIFDESHHWDQGREHADRQPGRDRGHPHTGHLQGSNVLVKDLHQVRGELTTMGSVHQGFIAAHDDSAVQALLATGAQLVGMSSTTEFGTAAYTEPVGMDEPVNPLNPRMMAGGSSGGAAVAVARGLVDIAHATDGGGSIRIPAACVGLPALKPAHDRTQRSNGNHAAHFNPTAQGFIARDLTTTARAYGLACEPELTPTPGHTLEPGHTPASNQQHDQHHQSPHRRLRLGYTNTPFHARSLVDPAISAATAAAAALAASHPQVASIAPAPAPYPPAMFDLFAETLAARCAHLPGPLTPLTAWLRDRGRSIPGWRRSRVEAQLLALEAATSAAWHDLDIIITPTLACAPPPPGTFSALPPARNFQAQTAWTPWGTLWNITGWTSVTVPLVDPARVPGRWPISLMLGAVGSRVGAADVLRIASFISDATTHLPTSQLALDTPGDIEALEYLNKPDNSHNHAHHGANHA